MNVKKVLPFIIIGLVILVGCDLIEQFQKGVYHTASRINSIQAIGGSQEFAFVDIEYIFTGTGVSGERAVFGRSNSDKRDTVDIAVQSTIYYDADTLTADYDYTYTLWLLNGSKLTDYDQIPVKTLPVLEITAPADTFIPEPVDEPLEVTWNKLTYEGEDYLTYEVALFDADEEGIDLDNLDLETFQALTTPLEGPFEVELGTSNTEGSYTFSHASSYFLRGYIVKVTTKKGIGDKLSNKSTAFKPFLWVGEAP